MSNYKEKLQNINSFIFDYDGVFTDGKVILMNNGDILRTSNVKDGYALYHAVKMGYRIAIISGGTSEGIRTRFAKLNITDVYLSIENKIEVFNEYIKKYDLNTENILYMGDDIPDYEVMNEVGLACCPADASEEIKGISEYISFAKGGNGCIRDIIEQVLKLQGKWMNGKQAFKW